jgi:hypothetical protein
MLIAKIVAAINAGQAFVTRRASWAVRAFGTGMRFHGWPILEATRWMLAGGLAVIVAALVFPSVCRFGGRIRDWL